MSPVLARGERINKTERIIAYLRAFIVGFNSITYLVFAPKSEHESLAIAIIVVALVYSVLALVLEPRDVKHAYATAWVNTLVDTSLIMLWIWVSGGAESPYYPMLYAEAAATVARFGPRFGAGAAVVSAGMYLTLVTVDGGAPAYDLLPRIAYIFVIAAFVAYVSDVAARSEREAVESEAKAQALEELDRLRIRFITDMSHELRTPLTAIRGSSATLLTRWESLDEADKLSFIEMLERQSRHLAKLVDDIIHSLEVDASLEASVLPEALVDRVGPRRDEDHAGRSN